MKRESLLAVECKPEREIQKERRGATGWRERVNNTTELYYRTVFLTGFIIGLKKIKDWSN